MNAARDRGDQQHVKLLPPPACARCSSQPASAAARVIDGIGTGLRAAIEKEAMWRSTLRENYDDFGQWLAYSDMYGLAGRLGFVTAEEAWEANPTIQGSTDPQDFKVVPDGEEMEFSAALGWTCESCGSDTGPCEPCDCTRRPEARQPVLKAGRAARDPRHDLAINASRVAGRIVAATGSSARCSCPVCGPTRGTRVRAAS